MFGGVESHVVTTESYLVFQQENPDNSKLAEKAAELTIGALLDVPPIFNGQTFDAITWQARLSRQSPFFVQVTWIYVFAFGEYKGSHGGRMPCTASWVHTVATRWVAYEGDVWVLLTMDSYQQQSIKVSLLKLAWDRKSFKMNLSFCYQIVGFSRNKTAQVFFTLVGDPNNAERRFLGLFEISFLVLS